jgi:hypothetical protein
MQRYAWRNSGLFRPPSALIVTVVGFLPPRQIDGSLYFTLLLRDALIPPLLRFAPGSPRVAIIPAISVAWCVEPAALLCGATTGKDPPANSMRTRWQRFGGRCTPNSGSAILRAVTAISLWERAT